MKTKVKLWQVFWVSVMLPPAITFLLVLFGYDALMPYSHMAQVGVYLLWGAYLLWDRFYRGSATRLEIINQAMSLLSQILTESVQFVVSELPHERIVSIGVRKVPGAYYLVQVKSFLHEPKFDVPRFIQRYHFRAITAEQAKQLALAIDRLETLRDFGVVEVGILSRYVVYEAHETKSSVPIKEIGKMYATCAGSDTVTVRDPVKIRVIKKPNQVKV